MKKLFSVLFISILFACNLYSQETYQIKESWDFFRSEQLQTGGWRTVLSENNIQGSPYLNSEFVDGTIYTSAKSQYRNVPLRYNIYNDELEFKTEEDKIQAVATPGIIEKVEFGNCKLVYMDYSSLDNRDKGFLRLLVEGQEASLFVKSEVLFREPTMEAAFKQPEPAKFVSKPDAYYIQIGNEIPQKVKSKKEIIELFEGHEDEIMHFMKKNKIKPRKTESLIALVDYYNSL